MALLTTNAKAVRPGAFLRQLIKIDEGVQASLPAALALPINGAQEVQAQIHATLQSFIAAFKAPEVAKAAYEDALRKRVGVTVEARTFTKGLKSVIKQQFGPQSAKLASFGIPTDKPIELTVQQKLVAVAKRQQTRAVRGTKGKRQIAAITVVGNPAVHIASDGTQQISPPPVNLPASTGPSAPAASKNGTPGSNQPPTT